MPTTTPDLAQRLLLGAALSAAALTSALACRRRAAYWLGAHGPELAPAFLVVLAFAGLALGQGTGSLLLMGLAAAAAPLAAAACALARSGPSRARRRFGAIDWVVFVALATFVLAVPGGDNLCHYTVVSTYLRGNIPPRALNDPTFPLVYHGLFDAAAAVVVRGFKVDLELGLDVVTLVCVAATISASRAVTAALFATPIAQQAARVFFFLGFGPLALRVLAGGALPGAVHGRTAQPYLEQLLRRPMALNLLLFTFALGALLPRLPAGVPTRRAGTAPVPLPALLPLAVLLPLAAEELVALVGLLGLALVVRGRLSPGALALGGAAAGASALASGVLRAVGGAEAPMAAPRPTLLLPPALPTWAAPTGGVPLGSWGALEILVAEVGPVALAALLVAAFGREPRRRAIALLAGAGLAAASLLGLEGWPRADLDRFLFYGVLGGLLLGAGFVDALARRPGGRPCAIGLAAACAVLLVPAPLLHGGWLVATQRRGLQGIRSERPGAQLRRELAIVGPREPILTDAPSAQLLVQAGFIVLAPLTSHMVGRVDPAGVDAYAARHAGRAAWLFLPPDDPRVAGRPVVASHAGYVLVRAR